MPLNMRAVSERRESYVKCAGYSLIVLAIIVGAIAQLTQAW